AAGEQACGDVGPGRMLEPMQLVHLCEQFFQPKVLEGKSILISAGPTREAIEPVRYITNHSSGKMGFALANAAAQLGAKVTLVSGPVNLSTPMGVERINVSSAQEMHEA
ncbi:bifunctional phosphopantothenoylcysteine decarboxylase/phosphopantothenate synthase, partial [Escherichia coli]|nr:bifunctional phosphopantothenoylcysteine decarboxylase/phosphopantothenate synthase [Escherichia coli]